MMPRYVGGYLLPCNETIHAREELFRVYVSRTLLQRNFELIHGVQLIHMANDVLHFPFAMDFSRDVFERIHDFGVDPLVHILDDFIVMVVMRVHIQGLLGLCCEFFLSLGDGDNVAVVIVFEGVGAAAAAAFFRVSVGETFNHPELVAENILDGDESEDDEYA
jgi:hypothetical protein